VFANTKFNRLDRLLRRGRAACRSEWRLITATYNADVGARDESDPLDSSGMKASGSSSVMSNRSPRSAGIVLYGFRRPAAAIRPR
jgi:hypothetical protein